MAFSSDASVCACSSFRAVHKTCVVGSAHNTCRQMPRPIPLAAPDTTTRRDAVSAAVGMVLDAQSLRVGGGCLSLCFCSVQHHHHQSVALALWRYVTYVLRSSYVERSGAWRQKITFPPRLHFCRERSFPKRKRFRRERIGGINKWGLNLNHCLRSWVIVLLVISYHSW